MKIVKWSSAVRIKDICLQIKILTRVISYKQDRAFQILLTLFCICWNFRTVTHALISSTKILELRQTKAIVSAVAFILEKSVKSRCSVNDLENEMLQIGLLNR